MPPPQSGIGLVGMMVGLLISLLAILSMLAVYRLMIDISVEAIGTSQRDGQLASALLAVQIELQQAGFGIERTPGTPDGALLAIAEPAPGVAQVVWRFRPDLVTDACAGLRLATRGDAPGLYWLPPRPCTGAAGTTWADADLQPLSSAAAFFVPRARDGSVLDEARVATLADARFQLEGTCTLPFAQQAFDPAAPRPLAQRLVLRDGEGVLFTACLSNIAVGTSAAGAASP
ncbi:hypothetical protein [Coralloluteibacterium thermophilus]|uniref:Tfp pilus assembly protein PilW n=1 Tax=Coralloluteibacterium thermophilum TaxID=2707049 RepID=A0ABV9NNU3_9GAMM